jgi:hypothetical protein
LAAGGTARAVARRAVFEWGFRAVVPEAKQPRTSQTGSLAAFRGLIHLTMPVNVLVSVLGIDGNTRAV